ncbi:hypothetical protein PybrP1_003470 [[Pythium] brassicae (nom. inval.)]|nr:hypothetical protein PybrP1_003470 [[Pythium] brassicae (nom. inval.)]
MPPLTPHEPTSTATEQSSEAFEYDPPAYFGASSRVPKWLQAWVADIFTFIMVHYNLWTIPVVALFYYLFQSGNSLVAVALVALYIPSFIDGSETTAHGRPWEWLWESHIWRLTSQLLRLKIIREKELDPAKVYIFGHHPHGIIVLSRLAWCGGHWAAVFPGVNIRLLGASTVFKIPLARELCLWLHAVDASRSTAEKVLNAGKSAIVFPGGVPEIFLTDPNSKENALVLKKRLGFVKLAIRHGAELVPTFIFGEKWFYNVWTPPKSVVALVRKTLKIPLIVFWGRFLWLPKLLPENKPYGVVYGKPIPTVKNPEPSDGEIHAMHALYVAEVQRIFEQYKARFGYDADETLVIT